jgi:hypothetical protein
LKRASNVVAASRGITHYTSRHKMLTQLNEELLRQEKNETFEAFSVYVEFKKIVESWGDREVQVFRRRLEKKLQELKAPECVRQLLLFPEDQQVQLLSNGSRKSFVKRQQLCAAFGSVPDNLERRFIVSIDPDTALATIALVAGDDNACMLDAPDLYGIVKVAVGGAASKWKLHPTNDGYFKIATQQGIIYAKLSNNILCEQII